MRLSGVLSKPEYASAISLKQTQLCTVCTDPKVSRAVLSPEIPGRKSGPRMGWLSFCVSTKQTQSKPSQMFTNLHECSSMCRNVHPTGARPLRNKANAAEPGVVSCGQRGSPILTGQLDMRASTWSLILLLSCTAGCGVYRTITVKSDPPGALIYMNGLEIGRTPVTRDFVWYGTIRREVRKDGYQTIKTASDVNPPWWQIIPFDFFAELVPGHPHDHRGLYYSLKPISSEAADPEVMLRRAARMARSWNRATARETPPPPARPASHPIQRPSRYTTHPSTTRASTNPQPAQRPAQQRRRNQFAEKVPPRTAKPALHAGSFTPRSSHAIAAPAGPTCCWS